MVEVYVENAPDQAKNYRRSRRQLLLESHAEQEGISRAAIGRLVWQRMNRTVECSRSQGGLFRGALRNKFVCLLKAFAGLVRQ